MEFVKYIDPESFAKGLAEDTERLLQKQRESGLFICRSANQWLAAAKLRPVPNMLFDSFWFESELCILFADTNLGKSALAVQIADSISSGTSIRGFNLTAHQQKVLYLDFELSDKMFENRYSENYCNHYKFNDNFYRIEINPEADYTETQHIMFEDYLYHSIEMLVVETQAKVIIIDNITFLKSETEKARYALPLMKDLQKLKKQYNLSILILAHTPKRDLYKPITRNDLQGSKMLINFCDSAFTIGESTKDKSLRYLKMIKVRNCEAEYDSENIMVCALKKIADNFLGFEFTGYGKEREHLKEVTQRDRDNLLMEAKKLQIEGLSQRGIAEALGVSKSKVNRLLIETGCE
jgi:RecA-family ATPase